MCKNPGNFAARRANLTYAKPKTIAGEARASSEETQPENLTRARTVWITSVMGWWVGPDLGGFGREASLEPDGAAPACCAPGGNASCGTHVPVLKPPPVSIGNEAAGLIAVGVEGDGRAGGGGGAGPSGDGLEPQMPGSPAVWLAASTDDHEKPPDGSQSRS